MCPDRGHGTARLSLARLGSATSSILGTLYVSVHVWNIKLAIDCMALCILNPRGSSLQLQCSVHLGSTTSTSEIQAGTGQRIIEETSPDYRSRKPTCPLISRDCYSYCFSCAAASSRGRDEKVGNPHAGVWCSTAYQASVTCSRACSALLAVCEWEGVRGMVRGDTGDPAGDPAGEERGGCLLACGQDAGARGESEYWTKAK